MCKVINDSVYNFTNINVFIGDNDSGKTTFIESLGIPIYDINLKNKCEIESYLLSMICNFNIFEYTLLKTNMLKFGWIIYDDIEFFSCEIFKCHGSGFLYTLYYLTLVISSKTSKKIAIDNICSCLNRKLCVILIPTLSDLIKNNNKELFVTCHNSAILDGIDLHDNNQSLFIVSHGYRRKVERFSGKEYKNIDGSRMKLSIAFDRGYLNGLSKRF